jgi:drug/metabolite transporter (DMT)-like permease
LAPIVGGELAAILAAALWAVAAFLFTRLGQSIRPMQLNLIKGVGAILLFSLTLLITGEFFIPVAGWALLMLLLSGAIGISLGDTAYFHSLVTLGPRRSLLVGTLSPAMTALLALLFLGESLPPTAWVGMVITIAGVAWVVSERSGPDDTRYRFELRGVLYAFLAALCQSASSILSRLVFIETMVTPLQSALIRVVGGVVALLVWFAIIREPAFAWMTTITPRRWVIVVISILVGTYFAVWLQQVSFKVTPVAIAQTLLSTSPLFVLPIALWNGEKITLRSVLGAILALLGVALLFGLL